MPQSNAPPSDMGSEEMQQLMDAGSEDEEDEEGDSAEDGSVDFDLLEEANGDQVDEDEPRQPVSVSTLKARMASAVRALGDWKHVGQQIAGGTKSRSDVMNQFIQDVCEYYGYNAFLAEKLIELFPIDEVRSRAFFRNKVCTWEFALTLFCRRRLLLSWMPRTLLDQ